MKRIHFKHTLLISDACFSGSIFQTRSMNRAPMAYQLESNPERYTSAGELFRNLEFPVSNNSPNSPRYGTIQNVDDEGGDFIFD